MFMRINETAVMLCSVPWFIPSNRDTHEVHIWGEGASGGGPGHSTQVQVGPKGTGMQILLITFERCHLRSRYSMSWWRNPSPWGSYSCMVGTKMSRKGRSTRRVSNGWSSKTEIVSADAGLPPQWGTKRVGPKKSRGWFNQRLLNGWS